MKLVMNLITAAAIVYGIFEMKSYLNINFVENDTKIKKELNDALNGKLKNSNKVIQKTHPHPTEYRDRKVIIDIETTEELSKTNDNSTENTKNK